MPSGSAKYANSGFECLGVLEDVRYPDEMGQNPKNQPNHVIHIHLSRGLNHGDA